MIAERLVEGDRYSKKSWRIVVNAIPRVLQIGGELAPALLCVLGLSGKVQDLVPELRGEPIPALGELIEHLRDSVYQPLLLGREKDPASPDNPEPTPLRDCPSAPLVEQEKTAGALPREQNRTCLARTEGKAQKLQLLASGPGSRFEPTFFHGRTERS